MTIVDTGAALHEACAAAGLDSTGATVLSAHATSVYLLPRERLVARLARGDRASQEADRSVSICAWLRTHGFPAPAPASLTQPVQVDDHIATFWMYYPQQAGRVPGVSTLGGLLRALHDLPSAPVDLPQYQPLASLPEAVTTSDCLSNGDRAWLLDERDLLLSAYASLDWPLGVGLIHGDAYVGNLLMDGSRAVLGDWEEVSVGPRELDLANTYHTIRFGQPVSVLQEFTEAYGRDITAWPGLAALIAIRDLHTLSSFIKRADCGDEIANDELHYRIGTLRRRDSTALWTSSVPLNS